MLLICALSSNKVVHLRDDEWQAVRQLFDVDVELRRELIVDDEGQDNVIFVPGVAVLFLCVKNLSRLYDYWNPLLTMLF